MGYYIDLEKISTGEYRDKLESAYLPPSRMILKEKLDERFGHLNDMGIRNVKELLQLLRKKDKFAELQKTSCFSGEYLTVLLRELNSLLPKPNKVGDFPGVSNDTVMALEELGIKDTLKLFDKVLTPESRAELAQLTGISASEVLKLAKFTDLSRIKWVGVSFANMLCQTGFDTVEKLADADPVWLHEKINQVNKENSFYKGQIGLNDMKIVVETAKEVPVQIKF
jgi:hypothetical protein